MKAEDNVGREAYKVYVYIDVVFVSYAVMSRKLPTNLGKWNTKWKLMTCGRSILNSYGPNNHLMAPWTQK